MLNLTFRRHPLVSAVTLASLLLPLATLEAAPRPYSEVRSQAMGLTGVTSARSFAALLHNPALLAAPHPEHKDDWSLVLPSFGATAAFDEDLADKVDAFQDNNRWDTLQNALNTLNTVNDGSDVDAIRSSLQNVVDTATAADADLRALDNSAAEGNVGAAIGFANPGPELGFGLYATTSLDFFAIARYEDEAAVAEVIDQANALLAIENPTVDDLNDDILSDISSQDPDSEGEIIGVAVTEIGLTFARAFEIGGQSWQLGVTPKFQEIRTFYYIANLDNFEENDFDAAEQETKDSAVNLDLGLATQLGPEGRITVGLVGRNLIAQEVDTVAQLSRVNGSQRLRLKIEPALIAGVSYDADFWTVTADLDLIESKAVAFEGDRQMIGLGAEVDLARWVQLRAGLRHNFASSGPTSDDIDSPTAYSLGLGFTPGAFYIDLAGSLSDNEYGAGLELGLVY